MLLDDLAVHDARVRRAGGPVPGRLGEVELLHRHRDERRRSHRRARHLQAGVQNRRQVRPLDLRPEHVPGPLHPGHRAVRPRVLQPQSAAPAVVLRGGGLLRPRRLPPLFSRRVVGFWFFARPGRDALALGDADASAGRRRADGAGDAGGAAERRRAHAYGRGGAGGDDGAEHHLVSDRRPQRLPALGHAHVGVRGVDAARERDVGEPPRVRSAATTATPRRARWPALHDVVRKRVPVPVRREVQPRAVVAPVLCHSRTIAATGERVAPREAGVRRRSPASRSCNALRDVSSVMVFGNASTTNTWSGAAYAPSSAARTAAV